eukprot:146882-Alexandrium_andersonii.AAC.1
MEPSLPSLCSWLAAILPPHKVWFAFQAHAGRLRRRAEQAGKQVARGARQGFAQAIAQKPSI